MDRRYVAFDGAVTVCAPLFHSRCPCARALSRLHDPHSHTASERKQEDDTSELQSLLSVACCLSAAPLVNQSTSLQRFRPTAHRPSKPPPISASTQLQSMLEGRGLKAHYSLASAKSPKRDTRGIRLRDWLIYRKEQERGKGKPISRERPLQHWCGCAYRCRHMHTHSRSMLIANRR